MTFEISKQHQLSENLLFRQLFEQESSTYSYLLADTDTKEAVIIDPVIETAKRDQQVSSLNSEKHSSSIALVKLPAGFLCYSY